jgi:hypothetical protein
VRGSAGTYRCDPRERHEHGNEQQYDLEKVSGALGASYIVVSRDMLNRVENGPEETQRPGVVVVAVVVVVVVACKSSVSLAFVIRLESEEHGNSPRHIEHVGETRNDQSCVRNSLSGRPPQSQDLRERSYGPLTDEDHDVDRLVVVGDEGGGLDEHCG